MRMQAFVSVMFLLAAAGASWTSASAPWGSEVQGGLSPFVRRNMVEKSKEQVQIYAARSHYTARHPRRLVDTNCATACPAGQVCCNAACVDVKTDTNNCGQCRYKCAFSLGCCSSKCVNLQTDATNCGACGSLCAAGCLMGFCGYAD